MRYLSEEQILTQLNAGRAIEQWLGHTDAQNYRTIRWLRIDKTDNGNFNVILFEVFDDGSLSNLDIYNFEALDPDNPYGLKITFDGAKEAIEGSYVFGASKDRFVPSGVIQDVYSDFLQNIL